VWISWAEKWVNIAKKTVEKQLETVKWQIEQANAWVKQAESWLKQAIAWEKVAESQYETAKTALEELNNVLDWKEKIIYENSNDAITNSVILYTNILDFADQLLSVTKDNKDSNKKFRDYLSAKNTKYLREAKYNFLTTYNLFKEFEHLYHTKIENNTATKEDLKNILEKWKKVALNIKILLKNLYNVVDSSIDNVYFPLSQINNLKNEISWMWVKVESSLITIQDWVMLWLKWSLQSIDSFDREKSMQVNLAKKKLKTAYEWLQAAKKQVELAKAWIEMAKSALLTAQKSYEQYKEMWEWKIVDIETKRDSAKKQKELTLDKKNELLKQVESLKAMKQAKLKEIDAKITEALWQKKQSEIMIKNWKVYSPVNWIITQKMAEIWQVIGAWMPIYMISDNSKIKLKVWIPDEIIKNIKIWQKVKIEFESWINTEGKITSIPNTKNRFTKKTPIEIQVENKKLNIKVWDLAKIFFPSKKKWIVIPNSAIIEKFMLPWVYVINWHKVEFRKIKIISSTPMDSEVTWLKVWEYIVVWWKENLYDWEILK
jgi:multidrug resistance efflux pump